MFLQGPVRKSLYISLFISYLEGSQGLTSEGSMGIEVDFEFGRVLQIPMGVPAVQC